MSIQNRSLPARLQPTQGKPAAANADAPVPDSAAPLSSDMLYGAAEIQAFLGVKSVKQVYYLHERGQAPIGKLPGFGLVASKKALRNWFQQNVPGLAS